MDPGLLPAHHFPQTGPCPQSIDHGQDRQRARAQWPLLPRLGDEGGVSLGQQRGPLAHLLN